MSRTLTKKSHSWWWDSHISPKNSKWLAENLEQMDQGVKRMLKLIEEDGDSFAKKAEMYYQKRPELVARVEELYRMYRSLAERYDHVTGELRKNVPSDLQSQGSGASDAVSVPLSTLSSTDQGLTRRISGSRAAGLEFFLSTGGSSSDLCDKGEESSTLDSESESDNSSINNYSGQATNDDQGLHRMVIELEAELRDVKEKLRMQHREHLIGPFRETSTGNHEALLARNAGYEDELRAAKGNIQLANEEIARLRNLLGESDRMQKDIKTNRSALETEETQGTALQLVRLEGYASDPEQDHVLQKEVAILKHQLESSRSSTQHLHEQLDSAKKDASMCKAKLDKEKRETSKLQDRISRYKANLSEREQEIRALKETISNANKSLSEENLLLQTKITKLLKERVYLEDTLKEWDLRCQSVAEEVKRVKAGKAEMETLFRAEVEQLKAGIAERDDHVEQLNKNVHMLTLKYNRAMMEADELNIKMSSLTAEVSSKNDRIDQMSMHLHELNTKHIELLAETEKAQKVAEGLSLRVKSLEEEVEKRREIIVQGAEEKRAAIRQLCFSLEHYRSGYHELRQAFIGKRRSPVMAS